MEKSRQMVDVGSLKYAKHNPPSRITEKNLRTLVDSMETLGLLQPITVDLNYQIIDGHRRAASAKKLGWKTIEANVVKNCDANAVFGSINTTSRKLSGCDALYVYLEEPAAVVRSTRLKFDEMVEVLGRPLVKKICKSGNSWRIYVNAKQIAKYCDDESVESMQQIVEWLLAFPVQRTAIQAMASGESPRTIMRAVKEMKTVRLKMAIG